VHLAGPRGARRAATAASELAAPRRACTQRGVARLARQPRALARVAQRSASTRCRAAGVRLGQLRQVPLQRTGPWEAPRWARPGERLSLWWRRRARVLLGACCASRATCGSGAVCQLLAPLAPARGG